MSSEDEIGGAGGILLGLSWNHNGVANDCSEAIDLGTKLDLDDVAGLEGDGSLGLVRLEWGVWGDEGIWGDGRWVGNTCQVSVIYHRISQSGRHTLCDLLSSVNLGNLLLEELVSLLADVYDLLTSNAELGDGIEDLVGDNTSILILGKGVWVGEGVVWIGMISAICSHHHISRIGGSLRWRAATEALQVGCHDEVNSGVTTFRAFKKWQFLHVPSSFCSVAIFAIVYR